MAVSRSVNAIINASAKARRGLSDLDLQLQTEIDEIDFVAFRDGRDLKKAEKDRRRQLRSTQAEVREGYQELAYVTLRRLDDSDEVKTLQRRIQRINTGLKDDIEKLKKFGELADKVAKVADMVAKVAIKVAAKIP